MGGMAPARRASPPDPAVIDWAPRDGGPNALGIYQGESTTNLRLPARIVDDDSPYGDGYGCMFFEDGLNAKSYYAVLDAAVLEFGNGSWTVEGWAKIAAADVATAMSIFTGGLNGSNRWFAPLTSASKLRTVFFGAGVADFDISSTTNIPADQWFKFSVTANRADGKVYLHLNGIKEAEAALTGTMTNFTTARYIGHNAGNAGDLPFRGKLAGIRVSSIARYGTANYGPEIDPLQSDADTILLLEGTPAVG